MSTSRDALSEGIRFLYRQLASHKTSFITIGGCLLLEAIFSALLSSILQVLSKLDIAPKVLHLEYIPPLGSGSAGNMSLPHIDQAETAVTIPAKPVGSIKFVHGYVRPERIIPRRRFYMVLVKSWQT
jgi:hypothetical protein